MKRDYYKRTCYRRNKIHQLRAKQPKQKRRIALSVAPSAGSLRGQQGPTLNRVPSESKGVSLPIFKPSGILAQADFFQTLCSLTLTFCWKLLDLCL